ncbi:hypothetical protein ACA910_014110 [Epithemia clementina (nom. ined.)]
MGVDNLQCCYREQIAYSLFTKFREPKLYKMAQKGEWDLIPARCKLHPKEAEFVHKYAPNDTVLHRLLRAVEIESSMELDEVTMTELGTLKVGAVNAILAACRGLVTVRDAYGRTPLHYACMNIHASAGEETIETIMQSNPSATCIQDHEGRNPMHYLLSRNDKISLRILKLLVSSSLEAVRMMDMLKETPISILERRRDELSNVDELLAVLTASEGEQ